MSDEHAHMSGHMHEHTHHEEHEEDEEPPATMGGHGMLVFGDERLYFSHLPMFGPPHNFQVLLEVRFDEAAAKVLADDRADGSADMYTFDPTDFPIADLAPADGTAAQTTIEGTLVHGHFERGGTPIAGRVTADVVNVVYFDELDVTAEPSEDDKSSYLCFGGADQLYLAHHIRARPSFDQVLAVRLVPGTVRNQAGSVLDDDVADMTFELAAPVTFERADQPDDRLKRAEIATGLFFQTASISGAHGFLVDIEVQGELYLEIAELE